MEKLLESLERLTKIAAILAIFGYVSMRGLLNYLGVPFVTSLGLDRYLMEAFTLFWGSLARLATMLLVLVVLAVVAWIVWFPLSRLLMRTLSRRERVRALARRGRAVLLHPASALAVTTAALLGLLGILLTLQVDVAVGPLRASRLGDRGEWRFELALTACAFGLWLARDVGRELARPVRELPRPALAPAAWKLNLVLFFILMVAVLPLLFGQAIASTRFRLALIVRGNQATCGLLVLRTSEEVLLWQAVGARGQVVRGQILSLPLEHIDTIALGSSMDLLELARSAAQNRLGGRLPDCRELVQPPPLPRGSP